jgi:hypothetical protein
MRIQIKGCGFNNENMFEAYLSYNDNIVSYSRGNFRWYFISLLLTKSNKKFSSGNHPKIHRCIKLNQNQEKLKSLHKIKKNLQNRKKQRKYCESFFHALFSFSKLKFIFFFVFVTFLGRFLDCYFSTLDI